MNRYEEFRALSNRVRTIAIAFIIIGAIGLVGSFVLGGPESFLPSYMVGYMFWVQIAIGSLGILMIHHVAGGGWGAVAQRVLESGASTLPLMALLIIPLVIPAWLGMHVPYEWADPAIVADDPIIQHKLPYLNAPFFTLRTAIYFGGWIGLMYFLTRWSRQWDQTGDRSFAKKMQSISGPGLLFFGLSVSFASFDWMMSMESHWFSTAYGVFFMVSSGVVTFAFIILVMNMLKDIAPPIKRAYIRKYLSDHGNFLMATVMLWAYIGFSQYLIIWSASLAEFTPYYLRRLAEGWQFVGLAVLLLSFVVPFILLIFKFVKNSSALLVPIAALVFLVSRQVDLMYLISPPFNEAFGPLVVVFNIAAWLAIGGVWLLAFNYYLGRQENPIPVHDDRLIQEEVVHGGTPSHA